MLYCVICRKVLIVYCSFIITPPPILFQENLHFVPGFLIFQLNLTEGCFHLFSHRCNINYVVITEVYYKSFIIKLRKCTYSVLYVGVWLITVAARSTVWINFTRWNIGIVGLNPTQGMDVCVRLFCVCVVLCEGSGLAEGWSPVQGVLPTVYSLRNWKSGQGSQGL
jgi:hypothetical protein